jgi:sugar O-acyltransferase (sialic acid O-acetyltransferase NeuD family)
LFAMPKPVYLYGAGGHAKVILDMLEEEGRTIDRCYSDNPESKTFLGYPVHAWGNGIPVGGEWIVSIGDNQNRRKIVKRVVGPFTKVAHRSAYVSKRASYGDGTVIMSGVSVHSGSVLGAHCIINTHASVDHDCRLGDLVHIAPHATLCGHVEVGEGTLIGAGAVIIPEIKIGRWAVIGAGSVIRNDVPDGAMVAGNPGRIFLMKEIQ